MVFDILMEILSLENGQNVRFWEDSWLGSAPLFSIFPDLRSVAVKCNVAVASQWSWRCSRWRLKLRKALTETQMAQLERTMEVLSLVRPSRVAGRHPRLEIDPTWTLHGGVVLQVPQQRSIGLPILQNYLACCSSGEGKSLSISCIEEQTSYEGNYGQERLGNEQWMLSLCWQRQNY